MVSTRGEMGTDHDDRGFGIGKERPLDGRKVYSLQEANEAGLSFEASMPNPSVGI